METVEDGEYDHLDQRTVIKKVTFNKTIAEWRSLSSMMRTLVSVHRSVLCRDLRTTLSNT